MKIKLSELIFLSLLCSSITLLVDIPSIYSSFASPENETLMQPQGIQNTATSNATNIVLVHGAWLDGSSWSDVIPILQNAGHKVIAVQLPLHSLVEDVATVERAIDFVGGPAILVGHSYGGFVITNAGYNNPNVTGLVYIAAFAPDEGQSLSSFVDPTKFPEDFLIFDKGGFVYVNPKLFHDSFAHDVNSTEADIMAIVQKPPNFSPMLEEKSGPPAWKQLPTWYQVTENDLLLPPELQHFFSERMNATTLSINSSHMSLLSNPNEVAQLILNATKGGKG
jgi:pimeloyl-ACP methyl ester carboxylesterase